MDGLGTFSNYFFLYKYRNIQNACYGNVPWWSQALIIAWAGGADMSRYFDTVS